LSNRQRTISRKAASTAAQPMMRNCRRKFAMGARGGARHPTPRRQIRRPTGARRAT
jgi:hypothetical protein